MPSKDYRGHDKRSLSRVTIIAVMASERHGARGARGKNSRRSPIQQDLLRRQVQDLLNESVSKLWETTHRHTVPHIESVIRQKDGDLRDLEKYLPETQREKTRAIVDYVDLQVEGEEFLSKNGISHLVSIQPHKKRAVWTVGAHPCHIVTLHPEGMIAELLHDIMLDIAMLHSFPKLSMNYRHDTSLQCMINKGKCKYLPTAAKEKQCAAEPEGYNYVSFASACRGHNGIDYDKYVAMWQGFVKKVALPNDPKRLRKSATDLAILEVLKHYKFGGQLSPSRLCQAIRDLDEGVYALMSTAVRPNRKPDRDRVASLVGSGRWRCNRWRIVKFEEIDQYLRYWPFLAFFKFSVAG